MKEYTIAFVGNPNTGKSAWINVLSHSNFQVGNWAGVTVEKKEATLIWKQNMYHLIDLPGCYALDEGYNEERITTTYLKENHVDVIVNVVDATNLARNLLLTLYLRELQIPMVMLLNFMDEAEKQHIVIETQKIARRLQIPVLACSAFDKSCYARVKESIMAQVGKDVLYYPLLDEDLVKVYIRILELLEKAKPVSLSFTERQFHQLTLSLIYRKKEAIRQADSWGIHKETIEEMLQGYPIETIENTRFHVIDSLLKYVKQDVEKRYERSMKIDKILLHPIFALPIFFLFMLVFLVCIFHISKPWTNWINDMLQLYGGAFFSFVLQDFPLIRQLFVDGILAGLSGVLSFVPLMACLYIALGILEESGYMARIAFLLDRIMRQFHLSGKSFVALLMGFGCNVPAIYASKTLDGEGLKKRCALLVPFMSCGARLPVYSLFCAAFFPDKEIFVLVCLYGIGILVALVFGIILYHGDRKKEKDIFVLEVPPYRLPRLSIIWKKAKKEVQAYVKKACGIVLFAMCILWCFSYSPTQHIEDSLLAKGAKQVSFLFEPLGFGNRWECVASLPGGILAKETIVGYFSSLQSTQQKQEHVKLGWEDIKERTTTSISQTLFLSKEEPQEKDTSYIQNLWHDERRNLRAFSFLVYILLSVPCIMTLQALYHTYGKKVMLTSIVAMLVIPYIVSFCIFHFFSLFY